MRQIVLDTETTGLSAEGGDRIIEIGCVELVARKLTGNNLHFYLNPERDSHEDALKVHGISNEFLRDKPKFAEVAADILRYLEGAEIDLNADRMPDIVVVVSQVPGSISPGSISGSSSAPTRLVVLVDPSRVVRAE